MQASLLAIRGAAGHARLRALVYFLAFSAPAVAAAVDACPSHASDQPGCPGGQAGSALFQRLTGHPAIRSAEAKHKVPASASHSASAKRVAASRGQPAAANNSSGRQHPVDASRWPAPSGWPAASSFKSAAALGLDDFARAEWSRFAPPPQRREVDTSIQALFSSVVLIDWCLFLGTIGTVFILQHFVLERLSPRCGSCLAGCMWALVAGFYASAMWVHLGRRAAVNWVAGYLLELIFLIENVFVFDIVIQAFKMPQQLVGKALSVVVWVQIVFQLIFFMGLAAYLQRFRALPYLLGIWLIFCGCISLRGRGLIHKDTMDMGYIRGIFGEYVTDSFDECLMVRDQLGRWRLSLLAVVTIMLLVVDFLLEIDVVLTKIEEINNHYIAFTSSAVATFAIPELYAASRMLLRRFALLKYGIAVVLLFFGVQMLFYKVYVVQPIVACIFQLGVLGFTMVISDITGAKHSEAFDTEEHEAWALGAAQADTGGSSEVFKGKVGSSGVTEQAPRGDSPDEAGSASVARAAEPATTS